MSRWLLRFVIYGRLSAFVIFRWIVEDIIEFVVFIWLNGFVMFRWRIEFVIFSRLSAFVTFRSLVEDIIEFVIFAWISGFVTFWRLTVFFNCSDSVHLWHSDHSLRILLSSRYLHDPLGSWYFDHPLRISLSSWYLHDSMGSCHFDDSLRLWIVVDSVHLWHSDHEDIIEFATQPFPAKTRLKMVIGVEIGILNVHHKCLFKRLTQK